MRNYGNRTINVNKNRLIKTIKSNKENHIIEYGEAVTAYKIEVHKQLDKLRDKIDSGSLDINFDLTKPINNEENYDKIVEMFEWEENELVELGQDEFREYVQDETAFALQAKMSNTFYTAG